jgi:hypothetical protein
MLPFREVANIKFKLTYCKYWRAKEDSNPQPPDNQTRVQTGFAQLLRNEKPVLLIANKNRFREAIGRIYPPGRLHEQAFAAAPPPLTSPQRNCFGRLRRDNGHNRVPEPPERIIVLIVI